MRFKLPYVKTKANFNEFLVANYAEFGTKIIRSLRPELLTLDTDKEGTCHFELNDKEQIITFTFRYPFKISNEQERFLITEVQKLIKFGNPLNFKTHVLGHTFTAAFGKRGTGFRHSLFSFLSINGETYVNEKEVRHCYDMRFISQSEKIKIVNNNIEKIKNLLENENDFINNKNLKIVKIEIVKDTNVSDTEGLFIHAKYSKNSEKYENIEKLGDSLGDVYSDYTADKNGNVKEFYFGTKDLDSVIHFIHNNIAT